MDVKERIEHLTELPDVILRTILANVPIAKQRRLQWACKRFMEVMPFCTVNLDVLYPNKKNFPHDELDLSMLASRFPVDRCLHFSTTAIRNFTPAMAANMAVTIPQLTTLKLAKSWFPLNLLPSLPSVRHVIVYEVQIGDDGLNDETRAALDALQTLDTLISVKNLRTLCAVFLSAVVCRLRVYGTVEKADMELVRTNLPNLQHLQVMGASLACLSALVQVDSLSVIFGTLEPPAGAATALSLSSSLQVLTLRASKEIASYEFLRRLPALSKLAIRDQSLAGCPLDCLAHFKCLTYLDVSNTDAITDDLLTALKACQYRLRVLKALKYAFAETPGFSSIALFRYLEWTRWLRVLNVSGHSRVTDFAFCADGAYMWTLEELRLDETKCEERGVRGFLRRRAALKKTVHRGGFMPKIVIAVSFRVHHEEDTDQFCLRFVWPANSRGDWNKSHVYHDPELEYNSSEADMDTEDEIAYNETDSSSSWSDNSVSAGSGESDPEEPV